MEKIADKLHDEIWELYKRLGRPYGHSQEALVDMVKLGKMAQDLIDIRKAKDLTMRYSMEFSITAE